jgi:hypothetical protein
MDPITFEKLDIGDIIRHKNSSDGYVVTGHYGETKIVTRTLTVTNPDEWDLIRKGNPVD